MRNKFERAIRGAFEIDEGCLDFESEFRRHDNWDSLTKLSLIAALDEEFDLIIEEEEFEKLIKFEDIFNFITKG